MKEIAAESPDLIGATEVVSIAPFWRKALARLFLSEYLVLFLTIIYFLAVWAYPGTPREFVSAKNLTDILSNALPLLIVAIGQTVVLITAGIDLSVTSIIALTSVVGATIMTGNEGGLLANHPMAVPAGIAAMLALGAALGAFNGTAVTRFNMPPFMVTLATWMFLSGFAVWFTRSESIANLPSAFNALGQDMKFRIAGRHIVAIPVMPLIVAAAAGVIVHVVLSRTVIGRRLYAVGHNAKTALVSGVPVRRTILFAYVLCGLCAAVASVLYSARLEMGSPEQAERILLDVVGAAVIGGTSLFGGKGKVLWTVFGVLLITVIDNSLTMLNLSYFTVMMVKGSVILLAALIDTLRNRLLAGA